MGFSLVGRDLFEGLNALGGSSKIGYQLRRRIIHQFQKSDQRRTPEVAARDFRREPFGLALECRSHRQAATKRSIDLVRDETIRPSAASFSASIRESWISRKYRQSGDRQASPIRSGIVDQLQRRQYRDQHHLRCRR